MSLYKHPQFVIAFEIWIISIPILLLALPIVLFLLFLFFLALLAIIQCLHFLFINRLQMLEMSILKLTFPHVLTYTVDSFLILLIAHLLTFSNSVHQIIVQTFIRFQDIIFLIVQFLLTMLIQILSLLIISVNLLL